MVDLKKLAQGRKAFEKKDAPKQDSPSKSSKKLEQSCADEVDEVAQAFRDRLAREDKRKRAAVDSEFWFAVCFTSREEKEAFLRKYRLDRLGDKYLDGRAVARVLDRGDGQTRDGHIRER